MTHELRIIDLEGSTNFWEETIFLWTILVNKREHSLKRDDFLPCQRDRHRF